MSRNFCHLSYPMHSVPLWLLLGTSVSSGHLAVSLKTWFPCPGTEMCDVLKLYTFTDLRSNQYTDLYKRPSPRRTVHFPSWVTGSPHTLQRLGCTHFSIRREGGDLCSVIRNFVSFQPPWNSDPSLAQTFPSPLSLNFCNSSVFQVCDLEGHP